MRDVFLGQLPQLNPVKWSETFVVHDLHDISTSGYYECEKTQYMYYREGIFHNEISSEIDNQNAYVMRPYWHKYTKIGTVTKRFWTAAFTDLDQWQFVQKLSFIILNLCTN